MMEGETERGLDGGGDEKEGGRETEKGQDCK